MEQEMPDDFGHGSRDGKAVVQNFLSI